MKKLLFLMIFVVLSSCNYAFAQTTEPTPAEQTVCLSQTEANAVYALAAKGRGFDKYAAQAEHDISERDAIITDLKIKLAEQVQKNIDLFNQATYDRATLEQYRQYFFIKGRRKCIGICLQTGN